MSTVADSVSLEGRDFLSVADLSLAEVLRLFDTAAALKA